MDKLGKESRIAAVKIRRAEVRDADVLPGIENSAGQVFRHIPDLVPFMDDVERSVEWQQRVIRQGVSWVAADQKDRPVGFLSAEIYLPDLHIWEFAVHLDWQREGIGRRLIQESLDDAKSRNLESITLTTFRDLKWNELFYKQLGFVTLPPGEAGSRLESILQTEIEHGWPRRCAMRLSIK